MRNLFVHLIYGRDVKNRRPKTAARRSGLWEDKRTALVRRGWGGVAL